MPRDTMAFISMKATVKMSGIVNVSGFHVDPGYKGRLTFALFNAGPSIVRFHRGQPCFLIWYAALDLTTALHKQASTENGIPIRFVNSFSERLFSLSGLSTRLDEVEKKFNERAHKIEKEHAVIKYIAVLFLGILARWAWTQIDSADTSPSKAVHVDTSKSTERLPDALPPQKEQSPVVPRQAPASEPTVPHMPSPEKAAPSGQP